jgi:hypothetical protein
MTPSTDTVLALDLAIPPVADSSSSWTVVATTTPQDPLGSHPDLHDNLAVVQFPPLPFKPTATATEYICYGLASALGALTGTWAAIGPEPGGRDGNRGLAPYPMKASYRLGNRDNCPLWMSGTITVVLGLDGPTVTVGGRPLSEPILVDRVLTGRYADDRADYLLQMAIYGSHLFGVVVTSLHAAAPGQTVGVWGAEADGPAEDFSRRR